MQTSKPLTMVDVLPFSCPRTCPANGQLWCKFRPLLDRMGPTRVNSHTVTVQVEYTDPDALESAVRALGWNWLGKGCHRLYQGDVVGAAFQPEGWRYPAVLGEDGRLSYDTYNGSWGDESQLARLKSEYALSLAMSRANELGWIAERQGDSVLIHHPSGGSMTVSTNGTVDANGFHGAGCHEAITQLNLGTELEAIPKPAYGQIDATVQITR